MKCQIKDTRGVLTSVLCFAVLISYHATRDAFITAIQTISSCDLENLPPDNSSSDYFQEYGRAVESAQSTKSQQYNSFTTQRSIVAENIEKYKVVLDLYSDIKNSNKSRELSSDQRVRLKGSNDLSEEDLINTILVEKKLEKLNIRVSPTSDGMTVKDITTDEIVTLIKEIIEAKYTDTAKHLGKRSIRYGNDSELSLREAEYQQATTVGKVLKVLGSGPLEDVPECFNSSFGNWYINSNYTLTIQGSILSSFHGFSIAGLILGYYASERSTVPEGVLVGLCVIQWGILATLTEVFEHWNRVGLSALRAWQGLVQGATYPCIYILLERRNLSSRSLLALLFSSRWIGSLCGTVLGSLEEWSIPFYIFGSLAILCSFFLFFLETGKHKSKLSASWKEVLRRDVIVICILHMASCWVLHTLLIAPSLVLPPEDRWVSYLTILITSGAVAQTLQGITHVFLPSNHQPARLFLLVTTVVGAAMTIMSLAIVASKGVLGGNEAQVYVTAFCTVGLSFGVGVMLMGYRHVLEVAALKRRHRAMTAVNCSAALGAMVASLWLPSMTGTGEKGGFLSGCLLPISLVIVGIVCVLIFLLFPTTKSTDEVDNAANNREPGPYIIPISGNGMIGGGYVNDGLSLRSADKSFKSVKSAFSSASFKTAVSRHRPRSASFNTIQDDLEADLKSLDDEASTECRSVAPVGEDDMHSIHSTEYGSVIAGPQSHRNSVAVQPRFSDLIDSSGDRTSAWLHLHHQVDMAHTMGSAANSDLSKIVPLPGLLL